MKNEDYKIQSLIDISYTRLLSTTVDVQVYLARTKLTIRELLNLSKGSVVNLERAAGDSADIYVNNRILGNGEIMVYDQNFMVRLHKTPNANDIIKNITKIKDSVSQ